MKRVFSFGLLILFVFVIFRPAFPFIDYCLRKEYIAKVFCINQDKPQLACNGKCHLVKQLKSEAEDENDSPFSSKTDREQKQVFDFLAESLITLSAIINSPDHNASFSNLYRYAFSLFIFHPPG